MCPFRSSNKSSKIAGAFLAAALALSAPQADARVRSSLESVNRPDLLPEAPNVKVIDVAGFLTEGEERRLSSEIESLEADTGLKLR